MLRPEWLYDKSRFLVRLKAKTRITEDNHWLWIGKTTPKSRGVITVGGRYGKDIEVHRVSAFIHHGLNFNDSNQHALHKVTCPYKHCWNPECLYVGTHANNMRDITLLDKFRCGHVKLNNSKILSTGKVRCKICHNDTNKRRRQNQTTKTTANSE